MDSTFNYFNEPLSERLRLPKYLWKRYFLVEMSNFNQNKEKVAKENDVSLAELDMILKL